MPPRPHLARRVTVLLATALAVVLGLTACTNPSSPGGQSSPPTTYTYETSSGVNMLDPVAAYSNGPDAIIENLYETLYAYTATGGAAPQPRLATSYAISNGNLTYTFDLRQGVTYHSGNPFTCADVEYSIERALITDPVNSGAWSIAVPLTGARDTSTVSWSTIDAAVTCPSSHQVVFNLAQVSPAFLAILAQPTYSIVDSVWAESHGEWDGTQADAGNWRGNDLTGSYLETHASGTGAYQLTGVSSGGVTASAYPNYWGGAPAFDQVKVETVADANQRAGDLLSGAADRIDLQETNLSLVSGRTGVTVHRDPGWSSLTVSSVLFNEAIDTTSNSYVGSGALDGAGIPANFFADQETRLCFAYAFDPQAYINDALGGHGTELTMALPPSLLGYNTSISPYAHNATIAQQHCDAAQGGTLGTVGFTLTAVYNTGNTARQAALQNLKTNLAAINPKFQINLASESWSAYTNDIFANKLPLFDMGWIADYADPDDFMSTFYLSSGYYPQYTGFSNSQIDNDIQQAEITTDSQTRATLYEDVGQVAHGLAPLIPLPQEAPYIVTRSSLQGVTYNPVLAGQFLWKDVSR